MKKAFVNLSLDEEKFRCGKNTITLSYISKLIKCITLPKKSYHRNQLEQMANEIIKYTKDRDYIGISTDFFSMPYAKKMYKILKKYYPYKEIEIGGHGIRALKLPKKEIPLMVLIKNKEGYDIELILSNLCPHNCAYCSSSKKQVSVPISKYIDKVKDKKIRRIVLYDNNPLHPLNFKRTKDFFISLKKFNKTFPESVFYCDPWVLCENYREIVNFLKLFDGRNNNLYFGRETASEEIANNIGRRVNGIIRSQSLLDKEKRFLLRLMREKLNFTFVVNYILTPFETYDSITKMINEALEFGQYRVLIKSNFLWAFPGTEIYKIADKKVIKKAQSLTLRFFGYEDINVWGSQFLDLCNALNCRLYFFKPDVYNSWYNITMLKIARDIYFKRKISLKDNISDIPLPNLKEKFISFEKYLKKYLRKYVNKDLSNLFYYSNKIFFNVNEEILMQMREEFRKIQKTLNLTK